MDGTQDSLHSFLLVLTAYMPYFTLNTISSAGPLLCEDLFPLLQLCWVFCHKWVLNLIKCFFCIYCYDRVIFVFPFVYMMSYLYWFVNITPSLQPWDESHLIMVYDHFNVLLDVVCQYFVGDFSVYVHWPHWPEVFFLCCVFILFGD